MHTLNRVYKASRHAGESECERQMQRLADKCDAYRAWLDEQGLDHHEIDGAYQQLSWHPVITILLVSPGGARERWVMDALRMQRSILDEMSRLEIVHELALLHPSWLNDGEHAEVVRYLAALPAYQRDKILAQRMNAPSADADADE